MKTDSADIVKFSIGTLVVVLGWIIGHYFTSKRDRRNKKRDLSLEYLINAYRILTHDIAHRAENAENNNKLELIVTDIQLFGSTEQIQLAKDLADDVANLGTFPLDPLINNLRDDLRNQIGLNKIDGNIRWLRMINSSED